MGESLDEEDEERVEIVSEKRQRHSSTSRKVKRTERSGYTESHLTCPKLDPPGPGTLGRTEGYSVVFDVSRTSDETSCLKEFFVHETPHAPLLIRHC